MKVFHCTHCQQLVFFENAGCGGCDHLLAYLPDLGSMVALEAAGEERWRRPEHQEGPLYRLCANYRQENVCNWAILDNASDELCTSCRLTRVIPDLSNPANKEGWYRLEIAKRRLVYGLLGLGLRPTNKVDDPVNGLAFEFLADLGEPGAAAVLTGHSDGVITINLGEADDAQREQRRVQLHEPYRTVLGHFRHEIGHYYWDQLVRDTAHLENFRQLFGDETTSYDEALKRHYEQGAPDNWQAQFISAYASSHPWEDWAETWAHYLHMVDALETAANCGLSLRPRRADEPTLRQAPPQVAAASFDRMMADWVPLTYVLNNLNRGLGLPDGYPFVLSPQVVDKLRFIHDVIHDVGAASRSPKDLHPDHRRQDAAATS